MNNRILRLLTISRHIPCYPYKLTARQIKDKLVYNGINSSLRTIQRDLEMMSKISLFNLASDVRTKPHGWYFESDQHGYFSHMMSMSLAIALKTWSEHASHLIPSSVFNDLHPLFDKSSDVIENNDSDEVKRWKSGFYCSSTGIGNLHMGKHRLFCDAIWHGFQFSADIQRVIKGREIWFFYERVNPLGIIKRKDGEFLLCNLSELDRKVVCIPFQKIAHVVINKEKKSHTIKGFDIKRMFFDEQNLDKEGCSMANY